MKKHLALGLAITFAFTACEEKETAKPPTAPAATETQQTSQEAAAAEPALDKRIPTGYKLIEKVCGDLNGDGADDCILIFEPANGESYIGFMIFFKDGSDYKLVLEDKSCFYTEFRWPSKFYIKKGNLYFYFESSGTCDRNSYTYTFKYRNSEFELIGYDTLEEDCGGWNENHERVGGSISKTSTNYLTKKKQSILNGKETWSKITDKDPVLLDCRKLGYGLEAAQ